MGLAVLFLTVGCVLSQKDIQQIESGDYGEFPENYEEIVKEHFELILFDPFSAQYKLVSGPEKWYSRKAPIAGGGVNILGYRVVILVNAKNRMGGYVGWQKYTVLIRNGQVVQSWEGQPSNPWLKDDHRR